MNKNSNERMQVRYSDAFKLKVVQDIEKGKLTISEARRLYEINGTNTVYRWLRKYGKNDLIQKVVRIEMKDEKSQLKKKDERIRELESVIASLTLHNLCLQNYVDVVNENISEEEKNFIFQVVSRAKASADATSIKSSMIKICSNLGLLVWKEDIDSKKGSCFTNIIDLIEQKILTYHKKEAKQIEKELKGEKTIKVLIM